MIVPSAKPGLIAVAILAAAVGFAFHSLDWLQGAEQSSVDQRFSLRGEQSAPADVVIVGSYVGYVVSAYLSDLLGRKKNFILFAVGSFVIVLLSFPLGLLVAVVVWLDPAQSSTVLVLAAAAAAQLGDMLIGVVHRVPGMVAIPLAAAVLHLVGATYLL